MFAATVLTGTHSGHIIEKQKAIFHVKKRIPVSVFNSAYPEEPTTLGQALRKVRIDEGLQIKELAAELSVTEESVINWEIRGMVPAKWNMEKVVRRFPHLEHALK